MYSSCLVFRLLFAAYFPLVARAGENISIMRHQQWGLTIYLSFEATWLLLESRKCTEPLQHLPFRSTDGMGFFLSVAGYDRLKGSTQEKPLEAISKEKVEWNQ